MQLNSYLEGGPLMWMMPLHLHVNHIIMITMMKFTDIQFCECVHDHLKENDK